jgi:hypothetical protein
MTGRLPKLLIREKELAVSVSAFSRPAVVRRGPSSSGPRPGSTAR